MNRLRLYDLRMSELPSLLGLCQSDVPQIANAVNSAQRRLMYAKEGSDEGWYGTWAEIVFNVSRSQPYITLPREVARLEAINVCDRPVPVQNQFFEYLSFGNGRMPKSAGWCGLARINQGFTRNNAVTFTEMTSEPQLITVYHTDDSDLGKRALIQGLDANNNIIYSLDGYNNVTGSFVAFQSPSVTTEMTFNQILGIQKDVTAGVVRFYQHDPTTGDEVLLLTMQPSEQTAQYRRYYLNQLPANCCNTPGSDTKVQVTALAKLEPIPVICDTDYLLIQNQEAIIEECQATRYSNIDSKSSKEMADTHHRHAISLLNGELNHYIGKNQVAVGFAPFGSARLRRQKIGMMQ